MYDSGPPVAQHHINREEVTGARHPTIVVLQDFPQTLDGPSTASNDCRATELPTNTRRPDPVGAEARGNPTATTPSPYTDRPPPL
jgi:hypothetical protein